ncbi:methyltransferase domain-containing protein [Magnetovibrio sp. PR-2]|uniref:methyltransferase domain-containing protein n=1 Tax=Magnetovibrio sp. PR-2 TaxID=3120356 RepID=UPI002FCE4DF7
MSDAIDPRLQPALDLLNAVPLQSARRVTDLGCGPGNVLPYLRERFPGAELSAVDRSTEWLMLARSHHGDDFDCVQGDIARWEPDAAQDLIYANASLNQLHDHKNLFPKLMGFLNPGGVLAVQMPNQYKEPSHTITLEIAKNGPWAERLVHLLPDDPVSEIASYEKWLSPVSQSLKIWEDTYGETLVGRDGVVDWVFATDLGRLREALPPELKGPFRTQLADKLRAAYAPKADGKTDFGFRRLFMVATRG